eukprot:CAMPEP_0179241872 /NCGR_PEP_ID=MMETSP0797-20121207/16720_1 /TAXON_ID=47934 /ORGANISM="Dinophysis acuminata, Strain DAEP01" /LENGTH=47 /DNA_ID= /DNA_START= /DNA_END= /DNA_ORIENTATION=
MARPLPAHLACFSATVPHEALMTISASSPRSEIFVAIVCFTEPWKKD